MLKIQIQNGPGYRSKWKGRSHFALRKFTRKSCSQKRYLQIKSIMGRYIQSDLGTAFQHPRIARLPLH